MSFDILLIYLFFWVLLFFKKHSSKILLLGLVVFPFVFIFLRIFYKSFFIISHDWPLIIITIILIIRILGKSLLLLLPTKLIKFFIKELDKKPENSLSTKALYVFESLQIFRRKFFNITHDNNFLSISRWFFNKFHKLLPIVFFLSYACFWIIFLFEFLVIKHWYLSFYSFSFFVLISRFCIFITNFAFWGNLFSIYHRIYIQDPTITPIDRRKEFYNNVIELFNIILSLRMMDQIFYLVGKKNKTRAKALLNEAAFFYHNFFFFSIKAYKLNLHFKKQQKLFFILTISLMLLVLVLNFMEITTNRSFHFGNLAERSILCLDMFIIITFYWNIYFYDSLFKHKEEPQIWLSFLDRFSLLERPFKQNYLIKEDISLKNYLSRDDDKTTDKKDYLSFKTILFYFVIFICLPTAALFAFFHNFYSKNSYCLTFAFYFYHSYDVIFTNSFVVFRDLKMLHFYNQYLYIIIPVFFLIVLQRFLENVKTNLFIFCKLFTKMFFWFLVYFFAFIFIFLYVPVFYIFYLAVKDFIFYFL